MIIGILIFLDAILPYNGIIIIIIMSSTIIIMVAPCFLEDSLAQVDVRCF